MSLYHSEASSSDLAMRAEEACYAAWPAVRNVALDGWLLRFAGGHTNRANSVSVVVAAQGDPARKAAACEALYAAEGLPTVFRLSTACPEPGLDTVLDARLYGAPFHESLVLHAAQLDLPPDTATGAALSEGRPDEHWLATSARLGGLDAAGTALRARIFDALAVPAAFASVEVDGTVAAQAFGAVKDGLVCLNGVATAPEHRGRGYARRAVAAVLAWASERQDVSGACLQVMADNPPALALYRRLGFTSELSRYHYRSRALA